MNRTARLWAAGCIIALLAVCYFLFDPMQAAWMPKCPVKTFTGLDCPGCGSQRMIHALLHGDLAGAFRANAFLLLMIPYLILLAAADFMPHRLPSLHKKLNSTTAVALVCSAIVVWTIVRNCAF
ncbi:MAG: DUF2752 domain-containing protein [Muribaculum sp.]|nr:DUF2752 domain-containing protein [Muribaculum sp.]